MSAAYPEMNAYQGLTINVPGNMCPGNSIGSTNSDTVNRRTTAGRDARTERWPWEAGSSIGNVQGVTQAGG